MSLQAIKRWVIRGADETATHKKTLQELPF